MRCDVRGGVLKPQFHTLDALSGRMDQSTFSGMMYKPKCHNGPSLSLRAINAIEARQSQGAGDCPLWVYWVWCLRAMGYLVDRMERRLTIDRWQT